MSTSTSHLTTHFFFQDGHSVEDKEHCTHHTRPPTHAGLQKDVPRTGPQEWCLPADDWVLTRPKDLQVSPPSVTPESKPPWQHKGRIYHHLIHVFLKPTLSSLINITTFLFGTRRIVIIHSWYCVVLITLIIHTPSRGLPCLYFPSYCTSLFFYTERQDL